MIERDQFAALQGENARLIALLEDHGIEWRLPGEATPPELEHTSVPHDLVVTPCSAENS